MRSNQDVSGMRIAVNLTREREESTPRVRRVRRGKDRAHPSPFEDLASEAFENGVHSSLEGEVPALQLLFIVDLAAEESNREEKNVGGKRGFQHTNEGFGRVKRERRRNEGSNGRLTRQQTP